MPVPPVSPAVAIPEPAVNDEQPADEGGDEADELVEYAFYQSGFIATQGFRQSNASSSRPGPFPTVSKSRSTTDLQSLRNNMADADDEPIENRRRLPSVITSITPKLGADEVPDDAALSAATVGNDDGEWIQAPTRKDRVRKRNIGGSKEL